MKRARLRKLARRENRLEQRRAVQMAQRMNRDPMGQALLGAGGVPLMGGTILDRVAASTFGVMRQPGETDAGLRHRLQGLLGVHP